MRDMMKWKKFQNIKMYYLLKFGVKILKISYYVLFIANFSLFRSWTFDEMTQYQLDIKAEKKLDQLIKYEFKI